MTHRNLTLFFLVGNIIGMFIAIKLCFDDKDLTHMILFSINALSAWLQADNLDENSEERLDTKLF